MTRSGTRILRECTPEEVMATRIRDRFHEDVKRAKWTWVYSSSHIDMRDSPTSGIVIGGISFEREINWFAINRECSG